MKMHLIASTIIILFFVLWSSENIKANDIDSNNSLMNYSINEDYLTNDEYADRMENEGISAMVLHYTALSFKKSLQALTAGDLSTHWLIPIGGNSIYKIVDEDKRARHAGTSLWKNRKNVNVISVGIEIVNQGYKCKKRKRVCNKDDLIWQEFPENQQKLIVSLAKDIQKRYQIDPLCVIGHSDIAVDRKSDPGPVFPWQKLAENGVGAWVTEKEIETEITNINNSIQGNISKLLVQIRLYEFGYDIKKSSHKNQTVQNRILRYNYNVRDTEISNLSALNKANKYGNKNPQNNIFDDEKTNFAVQAFLMHYLPSIYFNYHSTEHYLDHFSKRNPKNDPDNESDYLAKDNPVYHNQNLKILATLQALFIKYPKKVRTGCGLFYRE